MMDAVLKAEIDALHARAAGDRDRWAARTISEDGLVRMGEFYIAVSPEEGQLLHLLTAIARARHVVEFGASFGISSLYFTAALRQTKGRLTTTEVHPDKCAALRDTFAQAGVADMVTLLEGDARETLKSVEGPVDVLFLDGWKSMYLPVFNLMRPKLAPGALVLADNVDMAGSEDFVAAATAPDAGTLWHRMGDMLVVRLSA